MHANLTPAGAVVEVSYGPFQPFAQARPCRQRAFCTRHRPHSTRRNAKVRDPEPDATSVVHGHGRREVVRIGAFAAIPAWLAVPAKSGASVLPPSVDRAWEAIGGGPADLTFPEAFMGRWIVNSKLVRVDLPMGMETLPAALAASVRRAQRDDLGTPLQYGVRFIRNGSGQPIIDRSFNLIQLLAAYGTKIQEEDVSWNPDNPNVVDVRLGNGGVRATTRVTRRSEDRLSPDRIDTSEFYQQTIFANPTGEPRVKASQCFTKYLFRDEAQAEAEGPTHGPAIVATQVVSDYLLDQPSTLSRPVVIYTYRMAFSRRGFGTGFAPDAALTAS